MDSSFKVPKIPTIFVEEKTSRKKGLLEKLVRRKKSVEEPKKQTEDVSSENQNVSNSDVSKSVVETNATNESTVLPKLELCPACSRVILAYFKPLQMCINDIVKLAENQLKLDENVNVVENVTLTNINIEETKRQFSQGSYEHRDGKPEFDITKSTTTNEYVSNVSTAQQAFKEQQEMSTRSSPEFLKQFETNLDQFSASSSSAPETTNANDGSKNYFAKDVTVKVEEMKTVNTEIDRSTECVDHRAAEKSKSADYDVTGNSKSDDHRVTENNKSFIHGKESEAEHSQKSSLISSVNQVSSISVENYSLEGNKVDEDGVSFPETNVSTSSSIMNLGSQNEKMESPFAVVTIASSNLAAANAIALVNSFHLTNNNVLFDPRKGSKIFLPFVIIMAGNIDPLLKRAVAMIFDEVIFDSGDLRLTLLNDKTLGMKLYKLQLWKALEKYEKCLYLESSTIVVGHITNLLFECTELSAAVDYLFPDYFNCSVFVFCPLSQTYEDLVKFAVSSQVSTGKLNPENHDVIDEMTILNTFFAHKWNRLSFIYNYVQNDSIYSQTPAFLKFGNEIKIVNFGYMGTSLSTPQSSTFVTQPWHIAFDILSSPQSDTVNTTTAVNNYSQFYLVIFIKRLWPILQKSMIPLLPPPSFGRRNWTVFELIRLLSSKSGQESEDHMFNQSQITFRRRSSKCNETSPLSPTETAPNVKITEEKSHDDKDTQLGNSPKAEESNTTENKGENENVSDLPKAEESSAADSELVDEGNDTEEDPGSQKAAWESGRVDWMGAHRSDTIIERLKGKIDNNY